MKSLKMAHKQQTVTASFLILLQRISNLTAFSSSDTNDLCRNWQSYGKALMKEWAKKTKTGNENFKQFPTIFVSWVLLVGNVYSSTWLLKQADITVLGSSNNPWYLHYACSPKTTCPPSSHFPIYDLWAFLENQRNVTTWKRNLQIKTAALQ